MRALGPAWFRVMVYRGNGKENGSLKGLGFKFGFDFHSAGHVPQHFGGVSKLGQCVGRIYVHVYVHIRVAHVNAVAFCS